MKDDLVEQMARAIMEAYHGDCKVTDWREAEWNPIVAKAIKAANDALAVARPAILEEARMPRGGKSFAHRLSCAGQRTSASVGSRFVPNMPKKLLTPSALLHMRTAMRRCTDDPPPLVAFQSHVPHRMGNLSRATFQISAAIDAF
jgi:hypothetical protein